MHLIFFLNLKIKSSHNNEPLVEGFSGLQFKSVIVNDIKINVQSISNCYIVFINQDQLEICKVINICKNNDENVFIVNIFEHNESFYEKTINSLKLGIVMVENLSTNYYSINIQNTLLKIFKLLFLYCIINYLHINYLFLILKSYIFKDIILYYKKNTCLYLFY